MGFGTKTEPPHAERSLPLISVLAGLARSSHGSSLRHSWAPRPTSGKAMTRFRLVWVLRGTAAAVGDAAARPKVGRHCRALGLFALPQPHDPHKPSPDLTESQSVWQHGELMFAINSA
jgi:hypothetical protein